MLKKIKNTALTIMLSSLLATIFTTTAYGQSIDQIRWKSQDKVRAILGEPLSKSKPIGTHATYQLWTYDEFIVAFANQRAFHMFFDDSLAKTKLN